MNNYISFLETNNGEFISVSTLEVTSIPNISILKDDYAPTADIENEVKSGLGNLLSEIYQSFRSYSATNNAAEVSLESLWLTEPVANQPYKAKIRIFIISRAINSSLSISNEMVERILLSCEAALKLHKYGTQKVELGAMGAGMGMGMAAGNVFGNMANQMFAPMNQGMQQQPVTPQQQTPVTGSGRFTPKGSGTPQPTQSSSEDPMEVLSKLKKLLDAGLIEQSEYDAKKREILSIM